MMQSTSRGFGEPNPALAEVEDGVVGAHEDVSEYPAISISDRNISHTDNLPWGKTRRKMQNKV
jgi:hypothetical protein